MDDFLYTGRIEALHIGVAYATTTQLVAEAVRRHDCDPVAAHVLGRALTAGVLSTAMLGDEERYNVRWTYRGALRTVLVDAGSDGAVRGLLSPRHLAGSEQQPEQLFGDEAEVQVVRSRNGQVLNSGTVRSVLQDVVNDLAYFHSFSDQVETEMAVMIGFRADPEHPVSVCRGLLLHALPDADLETFGRIRRRMHEAPARELLQREQPESDNHLESVLHVLLEAETAAPGLTLTAAAPPRFQCNCTREKMGAVLRTLPYPDRMEMVKKDENVVIKCQFCNERYDLTLTECMAAWNNKPLSTPDPLGLGVADESAEPSS